MKEQLKQKFEEMKGIMENVTADFEKFIEKGNASAGTRVRKGLMDIKKLSHEIRQGVQEIKNADKEQ